MIAAVDQFHCLGRCGVSSRGPVEMNPLLGHIGEITRGLEMIEVAG